MFISINYDKSIVCSYVQAIHISSRRSIRMSVYKFQQHDVYDEHPQGQTPRKVWPSVLALLKEWLPWKVRRSSAFFKMSSVFHGKRVDWTSCGGKTLENSTCSNDQPGVCIIGTFSTNRIWNVGETYYKQRTQHQLRERTTNLIVALSKRIDWAMSRLPSKELSAVLSKWTQLQNTYPTLQWNSLSPKPSNVQSPSRM